MRRNVGAKSAANATIVVDIAPTYASNPCADTYYFLRGDLVLCPPSEEVEPPLSLSIFSTVSSSLMNNSGKVRAAGSSIWTSSVNPFDVKDVNMVVSALEAGAAAPTWS